MKRLIFFISLVSIVCSVVAQSKHVVKRGETLEIISRKYGVSVESIKNANKNVGAIYTGKTIVIPAGEVDGTGQGLTHPESVATDNSLVLTESSVITTENSSVPAANPYQTTGLTDKERYRRSSLCLILLTHRDKQYAEAMERVFRNFPLPARYNEHNITDLRVISVRGKQSKSDIDRLIRSQYVAQKVVGRWFNRNEYTGRMNMDLIHERGGYGAFYADYQRAQSNVRGIGMLRDEGIELLQSTFVLVCDMDYIDKKKGSRWGALALGILSAGMQGMAQVNYYQAQNQYLQGDYSAAQSSLNAAQSWNLGSAATATGAAVVADIGGFRVKMNAYLYKLYWDDAMTQTMYRDYWIDRETSYSEAQARKKMFEDAHRSFKVEFVGKYKVTSSKTILRSWSNEDEVILDVCQRCVNKGMTELAKAYPVFRPRAPFYFEGTTMYSHIGRKEDVSNGKKYEIVEPYKDKRGQIRYKKVSVVKAGMPWDNRNVRFDRYFDVGAKGTIFYYDGKKKKLEMPGLQLREQ